MNSPQTRTILMFVLLTLSVPVLPQQTTSTSAQADLLHSAERQPPAAPAVAAIRKLADQGYAEAQYELAFMNTVKDLGVPRSFPEAAKWYRKAADRGNAKAQLELAIIYDEAKGVDQDYMEAVKWYRKAANQGEFEAEIALGDIYYQGDGIQDYTEAARWYRKAADHGNVRAQFNLSIM